MEKKYQVFVSSTYEDLKVERAAAFSCLLDNNCIPVGMEQFPASPLSQWDYITKMIDISDYYLLIIAGRYGSIDPTVNMSYTEKEFHYARDKKIPILAFLHQSPESISFGKCEREESGQKKLTDFRKTVENSGIHVNYYTNEKDLQYKIGTSITKTIKDCPAIGWVRADQIAEIIMENNFKTSAQELQNNQFVPNDNLSRAASVTMTSTPNLSKEAKQLLREACSDPNGQILRVYTLSGLSITTNQKEMVSDSSGRTTAMWEAAVEELLNYRLVIALGNDAFRLTKRGYEHNDLLQKYNGLIF